jgi:hypothetical protein
VWWRQITTQLRCSIEADRGCQTHSFVTSNLLLSRFICLFAETSTVPALRVLLRAGTSHRYQYKSDNANLDSSASGYE